MHSSKECFKCHRVKALEDFYVHPQMHDGHLGKCKECTKKDARTTRLARIEYYRAYDSQRAKIPERAKAADAISKAWLHQDKRRLAAHNAVARAVRAGRLVRLPCERCGSEKSLAHHEDYDKKLDVVWLCQPCHKQRHKEMKLLLQHVIGESP